MVATMEIRGLQFKASHLNQLAVNVVCLWSQLLGRLTVHGWLKAKK
jgi:hypothetical protein